jgi:proline racemase
MGVATVLVETGMVEVVEPVTTIRLDTPAGLVAAEVAVEGGAARSVTLTNVPAFALELGDRGTVEPRGSYRPHGGSAEITYDMAYGGNFYAVLDLAQLGIPFERAEKQRILDAGLAVMDAIAAKAPPVHPDDPGIAGCHHVQLLAPGSDARRSRHAMVIHPGWFDRSPCGTGTSARVAQLHARGQLALGEDLVNESFLGTRFVARAVAETTVGSGHPDGGSRVAVVPTITGRAWVTGTAQYHLDPMDPFPEGFEL